jgi:DNA topoisomerase-1
MVFLLTWSFINAAITSLISLGSLSFLPRPGKEKVVAEIKELADKADEVILATDPDREGEAIAWHIAEATKLKNPKRVVFHEITKEAVTEAMENPRKIDQNLRIAQEARRVLDRLVGYDLSGLIWKKVRYGLSAGRVQSPALRIVMEREREIRSFISHPYWVIKANIKTKKGENLEVLCTKEPTDKKVMENIISKGQNGKWIVVDTEENKEKKKPRAPFITSTLQQAASSRLGFAPSRTMMIAQKLYEAGHITYMRTDSTNLSKQALGEIASVVEKKYGKEYLSFRTYSTKSKNAQEAHEAIRPSHVSVLSAGINPEQKKLYELIWKRTVASQMTDAEILRTKVIANIDSNDIPNFHANGSRTLFPGWLLADEEGKDGSDFLNMFIFFEVYST